MKDVAMFVLSSGERIITGIKEEKEDHWVLEKPTMFRITPSQTAGGEAEIGFAPYVLGSNQTGTVLLYKSQVIVRTEADVQIETYYRSAVSGIAMPPKKQILQG
jgi:hypothetical protein